MRVVLETGTAAQAAKDLWRRGFTVGEVSQGTRRMAITEEKLARLLPWETNETLRGGDENRFQQQIGEKLKGYRRMESGAAAEDK